MSRRAWALLVVALAAAILAGVWTMTRHPNREVVVYVSEDQVFSEPILRDFERDTGITVQAVYDTEETKSAGVVNRLISEKARAQADVYWANEPIRADLLRQQGVSAAYRSPQAAGIPDRYRDPNGYWTGFSARARMMIVNTGSQVDPTSVLDYTDSRFRGRLAIANPLFGTTTAHIAALFLVWGDEKAKDFLDAMRRNGVRVAASNGDSADQVAAGTALFALVDSDDVYSRRKQGRPIAGVYPDQGEHKLGCFIVPNAVVLIQGGPHPQEAKALIDYLLSPATERKLAYSDAAQMPLHPGVETPPGMPALETLKVMQVDYSAVAAKMQGIQPLLAQWAGH